MMGMYSCKKVSEVVSQSLDRQQPFWTRIQLRMHLAMCGICSRFRKNMIRVDQATKTFAAQTLDDDDQHLDHDARLSEVARERIKRKLKENR